MRITQTPLILRANGHKHSSDSAGKTLNKNNLQLRALSPFNFESIHVAIKILAGMKIMNMAELHMSLSHSEQELR